MLKKLLYIVVILLTSSVIFTYSQVDDIEKNYLYLEDDKKLDALLQLSKHYALTESEKTIDYAVKGLKLAKEQNDFYKQAELHYFAALAYSSFDSTKQAVEHFNHALIFFQKTNNEEKRYEVFGRIGDIYFKNKKFKDALNNYAQQINIAKQDRSNVNLAVALNNHAAANYAIGSIDEALNDYHKELEIRERLYDQQGVANVLNKIGNIHGMRREDKIALKYFNNELRIREEINDRAGLADVYNNIGRIIDDWGNYEEALEYFNKESDIRRSIGKPEGIAKAFFWLGSTNNKLRKYDKAIDYFKKELEQYKSISNTEGVADAYSHLGLVYSRWNKLKEAVQNFNSELEIRQEINDKKGEAKANFNIADVYNRAKNYSEALRYYEKELNINQQLNDTKKVAIALESIGRLYYKVNQPYQAVAYFQDQMEIEKKAGNRPGVVSAMQNIGSIYKSTKNYDKAESVLNEASILTKEEYGAEHPEYAKSLITLSDLYLSMKNFKQAESIAKEAIKINESALGTNHPDYAVAVSNLATIYNAMGMIQKADSLYSTALEIMQQELGENFAYFKVKDFEVLKKDRDLKDYQLREERTLRKLLDQRNQLLTISDSLNAISLIREKETREKKERENIYLRDIQRIKNLEIAKNEAEISEKNTWVTSLIVAAGLLMITAGSILNRFLLKKKNNELLSEKNSQLEDYNEKLLVSQDNLKRTNEEKDKYLKIIDAELENAAAYVVSLLPEPLMNGSVQATWRYIPSTKLGGDSFGYHWVDNKHLAIYLIDVCGHGVGSALFSISVLNTVKFQNLPKTDFRQPELVLKNLNKRFQMTNHNDMYFTIWYGVYNKETKELEYACGGHPPALLIDSKGNLQKLYSKNLFIGGLPDYDYKSQKVKIENESVIYIFSDGVYEIEKPNGEMLQIEELERFLSDNIRANGSELDAYYKYLTKLSTKEKLDDDFSILRVKLS